MLNVLEWRVNHPTPWCFIERFCVDDGNEAKIRKSAVDICIAMLPDSEWMDTRPSVMARHCMLRVCSGSLGYTSSL